MSQSTQVFDDVTLTIGALASKDMVSTPSKIDAGKEQGVQLDQLTYGMTASGIAVGEGPTVFGIAIENHTQDIEDAIEADPQSMFEQVEDATAKQRVFPLGFIPIRSAAPTRMSFELTRVPNLPRWKVREGDAVQWWLYNQSSGTITDGAALLFFARWGLKWLND